jgi:hypothetical protein
LTVHWTLKSPFVWFRTQPCLSNLEFPRQIWNFSQNCEIASRERPSRMIASKNEISRSLTLDCCLPHPSPIWPDGALRGLPHLE